MILPGSFKTFAVTHAVACNRLHGKSVSLRDASKIVIIVIRIVIILTRLVIVMKTKVIVLIARYLGCW